MSELNPKDNTAAISANANQNICAVCQDIMSNVEDCFRTWISTSQECPVCRKTIH